MSQQRSVERSEGVSSFHFCSPGAVGGGLSWSLCSLQASAGGAALEGSWGSAPRWAVPTSSGHHRQRSG